MIQVIQGKSEQINIELINLNSKIKPVVYLYDCSKFPKGWWGLRSVINFLKDTFGAEEINRIIANNQALASFIFPNLDSNLNKEAIKKFKFFHARLESRLNVPYALFEAMARLLNELIGEKHLSVVIPDLTNVDPESLRVFENYSRYFPETNLKLVVGFATDILENEDSNGIIWERSTGTVQYFAGSLLMHPTTELLTVENKNETAMATPFWLIQSEKNDEEEIFNQIEDSIKNESAISLLIKKLEASYERYSFRAVVKTGLKLLKLKPKVTPEQLAAVHGLVGSAANFYQFSHHANPPFDKFLAVHLEKALEGEKRQEIRSALLYRITFTYAERMGNLEKALVWGNKAVEQALQNTLPEVQCHYHLAWAHIVRADVYAHLDMFDKFVEDSNKALDILKKGIATLEKQENPSLNYWLTDYKLSLFNLSIHQVYTGDEINRYDYSKLWHEKMSEIMKLMPRIMLFDTFHWVDYHRNKMAFRDALKAAEEGIEDAKHFKHGQMYVYQFCAGDFNYRLGDAAKAATYFEAAQKSRPVYNDLFGQFSINWFLGMCYLKSNQLNKAEKIFQQEITENTPNDYLIKIWCNLALIAAQKGDKTTLEQRINKTIDLAVDYGEQNLLLKVATLAGETANLVGDLNNAKEAYNQALDLYMSLEDSDKSKLYKTYLLDLYTGYMTVNGYDENFLIKALEQFPEALDDLESWWNVPKLRPFVDIFVQSHENNALSSKIKNALQQFSAAAKERYDCRTLAIQR